MPSPALLFWLLPVLVLGWCAWLGILPAVEEPDEPIVVVTTSDTHFGAGKKTAE